MIIQVKKSEPAKRITAMSIEADTFNEEKFLEKLLKAFLIGGFSSIEKVWPLLDDKKGS